MQRCIADSCVQIEQFRLLVLLHGVDDRPLIDPQVRKDIAASRCSTPEILHDIAKRATHIHGALGVSNEMPLGGM